MGRCRRHPQHAVVGICAHCLKDRLLVLMEEEENQDLMLSRHYQMSPNSNFTCRRSPSSLLAGSPYMLQKGSTHAGLPFAPAEYVDGTGVSHMAASYMCKNNHHSLSSSPQFHSIKAPTYKTKSSQRMARPAHMSKVKPFFSEEVTRKKRSLLWSILLGQSRDNSGGDIKQQCHVGDQLHAWKGGSHEGRPKTRRHAGARTEISGYGAEDGFAYPCKSSFSSSRREAHDSQLYRGEYASSLNSSPHCMASPSRLQGKHQHFPSPISKFVPTSPLQKERFGNEEKASPTRRQAQSIYGLPTHTASHCQEDESSRASWISSFFPGRNRRSKSISGTDAMIFSQPTHVYSVAASPNSAPKGRRKSLSFLNDEVKVSTSAGTLFSKSTKDVGMNSPDLRVRSHKYDDYSGLQAIDNEYHSSKHLRTCRKGSFHGIPGDPVKDEERALGVGGSVIASAVYSSTSPHALKSETMALKSPRAKLANFLNKRKTGTVSIDCGRDVRVSPMPMLKVKRDNLSQQELLDKHKCNPDRSLRSLEQMTRYAEPYDADALKHDPSKGSNMVESMLGVDKDVLKSPRLMSLQAMKQLLKSPKLTPVRTSKKGTEDDEYGEQQLASTRSSWSKAFSKTLSPMLGRKQKKKQGIKRQDFVYDGYVHTQKYGHSDRHQNNEPAIMLDTEAHHHQEHPHAPEVYRLYDEHHHDSTVKGDELLVRETHILPALDEKGPPQQYSFLSKDYSAFSFYFSPRRPGERVSQASKRRSVW